MTDAIDEIDGLADADEIINALKSEFLNPPPIITVTEWAERHRILSAKDSAEPGPYRADRTPYAREPMDCLSITSAVEEVILMWGAQTSKTTVGSNWLGYLVDINPGPIMIVQPTIDMAKRYSRQRLAPMIEESATLRRKVRENRSRDEANTTLLKEFAGGFMAVAGANSAAGLRSMPVRDLFLDEIDAYPLDADGEGDPIKLAEARQTTFARRKRLLTSTPTTKDFSRVEQRYLASDQCRFHLPCPHCDEMQPLEWGADKPHGLKWDKDTDGFPRMDTVRYVCRECGGEIKEHHKPKMLARGAWVPTNLTATPKVRGFHLSSLYSPLGWLSWSTLVLEWHAAMAAAKRGDSSLLRVFINTRLSETFEEDGDKIASHELARRAEEYPLGVVPHGGLMLTMGVDVQGDRLEYRVWAWGRGQESWLVQRELIYGDPAIEEHQPNSPWAVLTERRKSAWQHASGATVPISACAIDTGGHHTQQVYSYVRAHAGDALLAIKGSSERGKSILGRPSDIDITWRGRKINKGVKLWPIGTDIAKGVIYGRLRNATPGPGYVHLPKGLANTDEFEQLTAERLVTKYVKGRARLEWVKAASKRNEALDCAVYAYAAAIWAGIERFTEVQWSKLESSAAGDRPVKVKKAAKPDKDPGPTPPTPEAPPPQEVKPKPAHNPFSRQSARRPAPQRMW